MSELHKTIHWRRLRNIIHQLSKKESVKIEKYNLGKIICYQTIGEELQGYNVKFHRTNKHSCWVSDNHYDIFEIPMVGGEFKIEGEFLFLAHNTDFDYWLFGRMEYKINKPKSRERIFLHDNAEFLPFGAYTIIANDTQQIVKKIKLSSECAFGFTSFNYLFDCVGSRKKAYRTTASKLLAKITGINQNITALKGGSETKIYKKHKKK